MLHYHPCKHAYRQNLDLSVEVDERMSSGDHGEQSRGKSGNKTCSCWFNCFRCCRSCKRQQKNDDNFGSRESPRRQGDQTRARHIGRYDDSKEHSREQEFIQSCPPDVDRNYQIHTQQTQRPCHPPTEGHAQVSPGHYTRGSPRPAHWKHGGVSQITPGQVSTHGNRHLQKQDMDPRTQRLEREEPQKAYEGYKLDVDHRSPTRDVPTSIARREQDPRSGRSDGGKQRWTSSDGRKDMMTHSPTREVPTSIVRREQDPRSGRSDGGEQRWASSDGRKDMMARSPTREVPTSIVRREQDPRSFNGGSDGGGQRWRSSDGREDMMARSPTREERVTYERREMRTQSRPKSEYAYPQRQTRIDHNSTDSATLAVFSDISAVPSSLSPYEVSPGSRSMEVPTQDLNRRVYPKSDAFSPHRFDVLPIQSRVRFVGKDERFVGGTVTWTGFRANNFMVKLAVVRLDEPSPDAFNGVFQNQQLAERIENNRYLLMNIEKLRLFILTEGDYCYVIYGPKEKTNRKGFLRNKSRTSYYELHPVDTLYTEPLRNVSRFPDYFLEKIPTPVSDDVSENVGPITLREFNTFLGRNKGIQGKKNSCYLDTLLFSVFAFSADLDDFLFNANHSSQVASHLRHSIILPLRACHFVADAQVEYLRQVLSRETNNPKFETEARDIPECLEALFGSVLRIPAPLHVGSANFFNATFAIETFGPDYIRTPTFQDFLDHSSVLMDFCFREVPKYFFLQFPREVSHSSTVIPSLDLELNNVLYRSVKECSSCQRNASLQFPQLAETSGLAGSFLCRNCAAERGLNVKTARQLPEPEVPDGEEPDTRLVLTAVLCIELSHYNCFARCGEDRWVFFDSMSDQEQLFDPLRGETVIFNIPEVRAVPNFVNIIEGASRSLKEHGSLDRFLAGLREEHLVRLFKCAYIAIYSQNHF